jgi:predicted Zn-dependent protease
MCTCQTMSRRTLIRLGAGASLATLAGCDDIPIPLVSEGTAAAMGLEAWEDLRREVPVTRDPDLQAALGAAAARLLAAAGEDASAWEAVVFASPEANAFALPGNKIGVYEGMFRVAATPDQLAAVVGHEIGHLQADHGRERITAQIARNAGLRIVSFLLNIAEVEFAAEIGAALGLGTEYGLLLPFSRAQELEADKLGLVIMNEAGYAPAQAVELWRRMEAAGGDRQPAFLATHPAPADRIEAIEAMLPELVAS